MDPTPLTQVETIWIAAGIIAYSVTFLTLIIWSKRK